MHSHGGFGVRRKTPMLKKASWYVYIPYIQPYLWGPTQGTGCGHTCRCPQPTRGVRNSLLFGKGVGVEGPWGRGGNDGLNLDPLAPVL